MSRLSCNIALLLLVMTGVASAQRHEHRNRDRGSGSISSASDTDTDDPFTSDYSILIDRNIFLRDRHVRRGYTPPSAPPQTPEQTFVLTGIVEEDNAYRAYFENLSGGQVQKMNVGSTLARGKVGEIKYDQVAYDSASGRTWVTIGSNLTGSHVASVSDERVNTAFSTSGGQPIDPNNPNLSVEEKMRLRRMQQVNVPPNNGAANSGNAQPPPATPGAVISLPQPINVGEPNPSDAPPILSTPTNGVPPGQETPEARPWQPGDSGMPDIGAPGAPPGQPPQN